LFFFLPFAVNKDFHVYTACSAVLLRLSVSLTRARSLSLKPMHLTTTTTTTKTKRQWKQRTHVSRKQHRDARMRTERRRVFYRAPARAADIKA